MFVDMMEKRCVDDYTSKLRCMAMLSRLQAENDTPFINSRVAEKVFCRSFRAEDRGRDDTTADATYEDRVVGKIGVGIKTFINGNGKSYQKIAEFDSKSFNFRNELPENMIRKVAELRNDRIEATKRMYGIDNLIYHCVVRDPGRVKVYECPMDKIDIANIRNIKTNSRKTSVTFEDGKNDYSFNISKSTLSKKFITENVLIDFEVNIIDDPYSAIEAFLKEYIKSADDLTASEVSYPSIMLPLFSDRGGRHVPEKSGLNQWNADGRPRNLNEVYIPIPSWIHKKFPDFFPGREKFELVLPDRSKSLSAKVCQAGGKALMSKPNADLGEWLLRGVMDVKEGELLTYEELQRINIDSVEITKESEHKYVIDFRSMGSYDEFLDKINDESAE